MSGVCVLSVDSSLDLCGISAVNPFASFDVSF